MFISYCFRPRRRYYKRSCSFNPQSRFPVDLVESTGGLHRLNEDLKRVSTKLKHGQIFQAEIEPGTLRIRNPNYSTEPFTHKCRAIKVSKTLRYQNLFYRTFFLEFNTAKSCGIITNQSSVTRTIMNSGRMTYNSLIEQISDQNRVDIQLLAVLNFNNQ